MFQIQGFSREVEERNNLHSCSVLKLTSSHVSIGYIRRDGREGKSETRHGSSGHYNIPLLLLNMLSKSSIYYYLFKSPYFSFIEVFSIEVWVNGMNCSVFTKLISTTNLIALEQSLFHVAHSVIVNFFKKELVQNSSALWSWSFCGSPTASLLWASSSCSFSFIFLVLSPILMVLPEFLKVLLTRQ